MSMFEIFARASYICAGNSKRVRDVVSVVVSGVSGALNKGVMSDFVDVFVHRSLFVRSRTEVSKDSCVSVVKLLNKKFRRSRLIVCLALPSELCTTASCESEGCIRISGLPVGFMSRSGFIGFTSKVQNFGYHPMLRILPGGG